MFYFKALPWHRWLLVFLALALNSWLELVFVDTISLVLNGSNIELSKITMALVILRYPVSMLSVYLIARHNADLVNRVALKFSSKFLDPNYGMSQDEFVRFTLTEVEHIVNTVFAPILLIFLEVVIVIFGIGEVFTTLHPVFNERPLLFIVFAIVVLIVSWYFVVTMRVLGKSRQKIQKERFRVVSQAFESRWLLYSKSTLYVKQWNRMINAYFMFARVTTNAQAMQQMPRYIFEGTFIVILGLLLLLFEIPLNSLALVLILGSRLLPSFMKVLSSFQTVMYGLKALDEFKDKTEEFRLDYNSSSDLNSELQNLTFNMSNGIIHVKGHSGSGKSTLLKGLFLKKRDIAVLLPQPVSLPDFEFNDLVEEIGKCSDKKIITYLTDLLPLGLQDSVKWDNLSGGEKTRIGLIQACLSSKPIIILDEPDTGLDDENASLVKQLVELLSESKLVIVVSHSMIFKGAYSLCL